MGTIGSPLDVGALLFGKTRGALLSWLYGHPDERYYLRQLVRQTGTTQGPAQRELMSLTQAGLVTRTVDGRQVYFQANRDSPVFAELQRLLLKTFGLVGTLRAALAELASSIKIAFVYGSAAKGAIRAASDIDLLIVGRASLSDVVSVLGNAQRVLGREINPSVYSPTEFRRKLSAGHHFMRSVLREPKLFIMGDDDELGRLAEKRMADDASKQPAGDLRPARSRRT